MKEKNFLKHFLIIGSGTVLNLILGVITTPFITRVVDPVEYGRFSVFTMYSSIAVMVLCMGLDQALVRYYYEQEEIGYKRALLFRCIQMPIIASVVCSVLVMIVSYRNWITFEFSFNVMALLCIYTILQIIYRFSLLVVRLEYKSKLYSTLNILLKAFYLVLVIPALLAVKQHYFFILVLATIGAMVICVILSIRAQPTMWNISVNNNQNCIIDRKELLTYAYPYIISMGITTLFQAIDKLSLNYYCSYTEVGIYASTMTLVNIFSVIQTTFNTLWAPMAVQHYADDPDDRTFYQKGNNAITVVMFFVGLTLILVKDVFAILLGEKYREAAYILPFLIFNPIMYTVSETTVNGLVFMKKSKMQVIVAFGACITNIIGNTILVPKLGCQGAAISTGLSYIVFFTLRTFLSNKYFYVDFKLKKFYILTFVTCCYALYNTFVSFNIWSVIGYFVCVAVVVLLYLKTIKWGISAVKQMLLKKKFS